MINKYITLWNSSILKKTITAHLVKKFLPLMETNYITFVGPYFD